MMFVIGFIAFCVLLWWTAKSLTRIGRFLDLKVSKALQDRAYSKVRLMKDHDLQERLETAKKKIRAIKANKNKEFQSKIRAEIEEMTKGS